MKHSFKKALLAGIVTAAFCSQAFSEEAVSSVAASTPKLKNGIVGSPKNVTSVEKPSVTSKMPSELILEIDKSTDHIKKLDNLLRKKALVQAQNDLERLELEQAKTKAEMTKLTKQESTDDEPKSPALGYGASGSIDPFTGLPIGAPLNQMTQAPNPIEPEPVVDEMAELNMVYVTRIYGFGDRKTVTVYVDNSVIQAHVGDDVFKGVKMVSATDTSATFEHKKQKRTVYLTTQDQAYSRSFEGGGTSPRASMKNNSPKISPMGRQSSIPSGMSMPNLQMPPPIQPSNFGDSSGMAPPGF